MPAIVTHSFFADDVFEHMKQSRIKDEISIRRNLFRLGSQGPDLFFYYKAAPWIPYDGIEKLGNLMHDEKVNNFYSESFKYLKNMDHGKGFFDLAVYIAGYLCHYSLDRTTHPFIHYTSGIDRSHDRISWKYHIYHRILESTIDYLILVKNGYNPSGYKSYEQVRVLPFRIESVLEYYETILPDVYDISINRNQIEEVITGIYKVQKSLHDPSGRKYYLYRLLELSLGKTGGITSSMIPKKIRSNLDYLNLRHRQWTHPCHSDIVSKESFWEIYDRALLEAGKFMDMVSSFIDSGSLSPGFLEMIGDISYSTGTECGSPGVLKFSDSIFENKEK